MHSAAWDGDLPLVRRLVELGADRTVRDAHHGGTPLYWAEYAQQGEVAYLRAGVGLPGAGPVDA